MTKIIKNNRGSALVVALLMLVMLSFVGIASITTSGRDVDIAKNHTDRTKAFYVAEAGLEMAFATLKLNAKTVANDSLINMMTPYTGLQNGSFTVSVGGFNSPTIPLSQQFKTISCVGSASDGQAAMEQILQRKRLSVNVWNNVMFAGSGQQGRAINGNVAYHGPIHILGEGEPFTDVNSNGKWDGADQFTDNNSNGIWDAGEALTQDTDGDGAWDPAEPFQDDNNNRLYDGTLTATDLATDFGGTAGMYNNYSGMPGTISSRVPPLDQDFFGGELVYTMQAELRVKHGTVNLSGDAKIGQPNQSGEFPSIKETIDGAYVTDGFGGTSGESNVFSDNGTDEEYDLGNELSCPSINNSYTDPYTGHYYPNFDSWLLAHALVISGDVTLQPGRSYGGGSNSYGNISLDNQGNLSINGIVYFTGNVTIDNGSGRYNSSPIYYDGRGTIVSGGNMYINTHVLSQGQFPTNDVMGFLSTENLYIGTGPGASQLDIIGAFFAQNKIQNAKQNNLAGAMVSNYFEVANVPHMYHVPMLPDYIPPGMPGGGTLQRCTYKQVRGTW